MVMITAMIMITMMMTMLNVTGIITISLSVNNIVVIDSS